MSINHIFVYGTLRLGRRANSMLDRYAVYCKTCTIDGAAIYHLGGFPGLKFEKEGKVVGDLYEIPGAKYEELLDRLDMYEGFSERNPSDSLYLREKINVEGTDAWVYVFNHSVTESSKIASGDWFDAEHR